MKEFPKNIKTIQDFKNLLSMPEHKQKAIKKLQEIFDIKDDKVLKATTLKDMNDESKGHNTVQINNPLPLHKQKGFESKQDVADLIAEFQ